MMNAPPAIAAASGQSTLTSLALGADENEEEFDSEQNERWTEMLTKAYSRRKEEGTVGNQVEKTSGEKIRRLSRLSRPSTLGQEKADTDDSSSDLGDVEGEGEGTVVKRSVIIEDSDDE
jgi:hypothetical protein